MKKVINRYWSQIVLDSNGVALRRGIFRRQCKFLPWNEIAAVGFYVGDMQHTAYDPDLVSCYPLTTFRARPYSARDLFLYFSVFKPSGFSLEDILPVFRDERNILINLGGGEFTDFSIVQKLADKASEKILTFYNGKIINRVIAYHR